MTDFQTVAKASEIAPGTMKLVNLGGKAVVIANVEGTFTPLATSAPMWEGLLRKVPWREIP